MDLQALRAFLAVAETGSFVGAARALGAARASVRRRVDELEALASVRLLDRTTAGATLTQAGETLARKGRIILEEANILLSSVRDVGREPIGEVRLLVPIGLPVHMITLATRLLRTRHPRLSLRIRYAEDPLAAVLDDVDIVGTFATTRPAGAWEVVEVTRVTERLLASPAYLAERGTPRRVAELAEHDLLSWTPPGEDGRAWSTAKGERFAVDPILSSSDILSLRFAAASGLGILFAPDGLFPDPAIAPDALVPVLPGAVRGERTIWLAAPAALSEIPRTRAVLDMARDLVRDLVGSAR